MRVLTLFLVLTVGAACNQDLDPDERGQGVGYRRGIGPDDYLSNGERGNLEVTEILWSGTVRDDGAYDPDDIFLEFRNQHPRPIHMTGWQLIVTSGTGDQDHDELFVRGDERPRHGLGLEVLEDGVDALLCSADDRDHALLQGRDPQPARAGLDQAKSVEHVGGIGPGGIARDQRDDEEGDGEESSVHSKFPALALPE